MEEHPLIYFRDGAAGRRPALVGTRLGVWQVIETIRQNNNSPAEAAEYLEKPLAHIEACVDYYVAYQTEIDKWIADQRGIFRASRNLLAQTPGDLHVKLALDEMFTPEIATSASRTRPRRRFRL